MITVALPLSAGIMSLSLWSFLIADCKPGLRLLFGGLAVRRMALTFDLSGYTVSSFSCRAVASVEVIILRTGICCGVVTKLSPSARTSSSFGDSVLLVKLHTTCSVGILRVSCLANRCENFRICLSFVSLKLFSVAKDHQDFSFSHFPASTKAWIFSLQALASSAIFSFLVWMSWISRHSRAASVHLAILWVPREQSGRESRRPS